MPLAIATRSQLSAVRDRKGIAIALVAGVADIVGVVGLSVGAERGFISVVIAASAVFPVVTVALSIAFLKERLVVNQYVGIALVVAGLLMLGLGS